MPESVRSEMVANVWKVLVVEGDEIEPDQDLIILESMKMEIPVTSESGGTVRAVHVTEGAVVQEGEVLIEIG